MKEIQVKLTSFDEVKAFVAITTKYPFSAHVVSEDKITNAKSLIGFFSMDLSRPVTVEVPDGAEGLDGFLAEIAPFRV